MVWEFDFTVVFLESKHATEHTPAGRAEVPTVLTYLPRATPRTHYRRSPRASRGRRWTLVARKPTRSLVRERLSLQSYGRFFTPPPPRRGWYQSPFHVVARVPGCTGAWFRLVWKGLIPFCMTRKRDMLPLSNSESRFGRV